MADDAREERMFDLVGISEKAREDWRKLRRSEFQNKVLGAHRIGWFDRPGGPPRRLATHVGALWKRQAHPLLFSLDLRGLPAHGESSAFKTDVREQLRAVRGRWDDRAHFIVPIELDVQVPEEPGQKPTDLDNVMRYIAPAVAEELLRPPDGYIHGYRIHRVRRGSGGDRAISVRLMREGTIRRFEDSVEKTLEAGREWVDSELRGY